MRLIGKLFYLAPLALTFLATSFAYEQSSPVRVIHVTAADRAAKIIPAQRRRPLAAIAAADPEQRAAVRALAAVASSEAAPSPYNPPAHDDVFYPGDVTNYLGGPTVASAQHHPIYVNQDPSAVGDVATFLNDLDQSDFIHVLDQYVGVSTNNRYTLGTQYQLTYTIPPSNTLLGSDIWTIVHTAAQQSGTGHGHIYHVLLPQGVDVCYPGSGCYSPDNLATFVFCALHDSITFNDIGNVIFTLEPYATVRGCWQPNDGSSGQTPNGQVADSTYNLLTHETFETITDPDIDAWYSYWGYEIADSCERWRWWPDDRRHVNYGNIQLNGHWYNVQPVYSNQYHGCVYQLEP